MGKIRNQKFEEGNWWASSVTIAELYKPKKAAPVARQILRISDFESRVFP